MKVAKASDKKNKSTKSKLSLRIRPPKPGMENVSLLEIAEKAWKLAPKEDWDKLPSDLSANLDKYLYSSPQDNA